QAVFVATQPGDDIGRARLDVFAHGFVAVQFELLRQIPDAQAAPARNAARVRWNVAGQDLEQTGFAGAIAPDQPDFFAGRNGQGDAIEQPLMPEGQRQPVGGKQRGTVTHETGPGRGHSVVAAGSFWSEQVGSTSRPILSNVPIQTRLRKMRPTMIAAWVTAFAHGYSR